MTEYTLQLTMTVDDEEREEIKDEIHRRQDKERDEIDKLVNLS
jgi:hypothetical protein